MKEVSSSKLTNPFSTRDVPKGSVTHILAISIDHTNDRVWLFQQLPLFEAVPVGKV